MLQLTLLLSVAVDCDAVEYVDFTVQIDSDTTDSFTVEIHPDWAPLGTERFLELTQTNYWEEVRFFRVVDGFVAQFGIHGDPDVSSEWRDKTLQDEPVLKSNTRGTLTYAMGGPNSRTTQVFINLKDNTFLDGMGFSPVGKVVSDEDMAVVEMLYAGYGDGPPDGNGPSQSLIQSQGNSYLEQDFPLLSYVKSARLVDNRTMGEEEVIPETNSGGPQKITFVVLFLAFLIPFWGSIL